VPWQEHSGGVDVTRSRVIGTDLTFQVEQPATVILQLRAAASAGTVREERLDVELNGKPLGITPVDAEYGGRLHELLPTEGVLTVSYYAELDHAPHPRAPMAHDVSSELERQIMLRPSRYCPSDHAVGLALAEFGQLKAPGARARAVSTWINNRIEYTEGTSGVNDSAEDTVLTGLGVCRDFAHLGIMLLRALNVPARFAAVYAPGLDPMDFHAIFEAWHDDQWWAYDATQLVPRQTLVRIATGRDAADSSFATVTSGVATLTDLTVTATSGGDLPVDSHENPLAVA
jgi:transglutaminase-like putative cysteine protease